MSHRFSPISGWCIHCGGSRDDGRVVARDGDVIYPGTPWTPQHPARQATKDAPPAPVWLDTFRAAQRTAQEARDAALGRLRAKPEERQP